MREDPDFTSKDLSITATDFLHKLLMRDPKARLGQFREGESLDQADYADDIRMHPFFKSVNWAEIGQKVHKSKFKPKIKSEQDVRNIDTEFTQEPVIETYNDLKSLIQVSKEYEQDIDFNEYSFDEK